MQKLNQQATKIFCRLLKKMKGEHMKLQVQEFMPLSMERLQQDIETPYGKATLYNLAHFFEQNGDRMSDPEMCFLVVDKQTVADDESFIAIFPQMYRLDSLGIYEESILIENGSVTNCIKVWQNDHCNFANQWLKNIRQQGFLSRSSKITKANK